MQQTILQYIVYIIISIVSIKFSCWAVTVTPTPTTGILLPAEKVLLSSDPNKIAIYSAAELTTPPYRDLGTVHVETHFDKVTAETEANTVQYAKVLAAKVGANVLLLTVLAPEVPDNAPAGLNKHMLIGKAIYVY